MSTRIGTTGVNTGVVLGVAQHLVEDTGFAKLVARVLRAAGRRVGYGDPDGLIHLHTVAASSEAAMVTAVHGLRRLDCSWADIAQRLDTTEPAVVNRYAHLVGGEEL